MLTALIVLTGVFLSSLDLFIVNIAFPSISATFHGESLSSLSWVLSAYTIVFAAVLVPAGRWADRAGRKRAFLIGLAVFTAASALCAVAPSLEFLIGARVLQAIGGALMLPTSLGLLLPAFGPARKGAAIGLWSAVGGAAAAFGPPDRRAAGPGELALGLPRQPALQPRSRSCSGVRLLDEVRDPDAHKSDLLGAGLLSVAVASLVAAIVEGSDWGWSSGRIIGAFVLAAAAGAGLVVRSFRHPNPIIEPAVIRHRAVALADLSSLVFFGGFGALVLGGVLFLTGVWHESVLRAGFMIAPGSAAGRADRVPRRPPRRPLRAPGRRHPRLPVLRRRWALVDHPRRRRARLGGALPPGQPPRRLRRRPHAALARRRRHRPAAPPALRHRLRPLRHDAPDRHRPRGGLPRGDPRHRLRRPAVTAFHHAWIFMVGCSLVAGALLQGIGSRVTETADAVPFRRNLRQRRRSVPRHRPTPWPAASRRGSPPAAGRGPTAARPDATDSQSSSRSPARTAAASAASSA